METITSTAPDCWGLAISAVKSPSSTHTDIYLHYGMLGAHYLLIR